ncbi:MAG: phage head closure protein [Microgenomates group bacterium]
MIGRMDQRITLQRATSTADGVGGLTEVWTDFVCDPCPWANVKAKAGTEGLVEGRTTATFVVLFTIYNRDDVSELDRIIWQGIAYNIRGIRQESGRNAQLVIEAERGVAQ